MLNIKLMYLAIIANDSVFACGGGYGYGHGGGYGFYGYGGYYGHGLYDYPFYYSPAVVITPPSTLPVFIQQEQTQTAQPQAGRLLALLSKPGRLLSICQKLPGWLATDSPAVTCAITQRDKTC